MSDRGTDRYETLARMLEREVELALQSRFEELAELSAARERLIESLPSTPPPEARPALQRALLMQKRAAAELARGREATLQTLALIRLGRRAARGYAPAGGGPARISASA